MSGRAEHAYMTMCAGANANARGPQAVLHRAVYCWAALSEVCSPGRAALPPTVQSNGSLVGPAPCPAALLCAVL